MGLVSVEGIMKGVQKRISSWLSRSYEYTNDIQLLRAIRESLIMIVPIIMVGAAALVLRTIPIKPYLSFVHHFAGGIIDTFLSLLFDATFGILSIYMVISLSMSYVDRVRHMPGNSLGAVFSSLLAFGISSGAFVKDANLSDTFGTKGIFTAVVCAVFGSYVYCRMRNNSRTGIHFYTDGADDVYNNMLKYIVPVLVVGVFAALFNLLLYITFGVHSFQEAYTNVVEAVFLRLHRSSLSAALYIFAVHFLWFFGIHGGNALDMVGNHVFEPALELNQQMLAAGKIPSEIFSKSFFDNFVIMGGCGSTICLVFSILLFEKKRSLRRLAKIAIVPAVFNMNELIVFGLPIVYNPIMLIPFFLTPLVCLFTSTVAMKTGLVPVVSYPVEWTTPIILGGYYATGSVAGSVLQIVNLLLGIMIYRPFIWTMSRQSAKDSSRKIGKLVSILKKSEETRIPVKLLELQGEIGSVVRSICDDLEAKIGKREPTMFYQPQYNNRGECIGAEALLRWNHPIYGRLYPPLVIQLLEEMEMLTKAEEVILETVLEDMDQIKAVYGEHIKISVNVTGTTIPLDHYEFFLAEMTEKYPQHIPNMMLEITEQASLQIDEDFIRRLNRIREMGYQLAIDDFSMGNTSIKYLQNNVFAMIKLDGALIKDIETNDRSRSIVQTMTRLAEEFHLQILAEFVETEQQKELLEKLGCFLYQGYLYSPAVPIEKYLNMAKES